MGMFPGSPVAFLYWFHSVAPGGQWDYKSAGNTGAQGAYDDMMGISILALQDHYCLTKRPFCLVPEQFNF